MIFSQRPDLILMDIEINGKLSGLDIGRAVAHLDIPILYITALHGVTYEQAGELPGTIGYLVKPVDRITLRTAISLAITQAAQKKVPQPEAESRDNFVNRDYLFFKKKRDLLQSRLSGDCLHQVERQLLRNTDHHLPPLLLARSHQQTGSHASCRLIPARTPAIYRTDPSD